MTPLRSDELRNSYQSPTDQNFVSNQAMSSSGTGDRRLKRSRTMNTSSLASISEPNGLERKAKRTKSMKDIDDLPQPTTPKRSKNPTEKDPWEFPSSSISESSKSNEKTTILKTYGRLRRSHTSVDGMREQSVHEPRPLTAQERFGDTETLSQTSRSPIDNHILPSTTKPKRLRRAVSAKANEPDSSPGTPECSVQKVTTRRLYKTSYY
jgi:hypothetical protein